MPNNTPSQAEIEAFVDRVIEWTQILIRCADAAVARAHEQRLAGEVSFAEYDSVVQNKNTGTAKCFETTNRASDVLLKIAESELLPLAAATNHLQAASAKLDDMSQSVAIIGGLAVAAVAIAVVIVTPTPASIGAAGSAIGAVTKQILSDE